jgi:TnpA family transposase
MQISIASEEAAMLREILEAKRVDLLKEIAHTDSRGFRDLLRAREEMLERLLAQIPMTDDAAR